MLASLRREIHPAEISPLASASGFPHSAVIIFAMSSVALSIAVAQRVSSNPRCVPDRADQPLSAACAAAMASFVCASPALDTSAMAVPVAGLMTCPIAGAHCTPRCLTKRLHCARVVILHYSRLLFSVSNECRTSPGGGGGVEVVGEGGRGGEGAVESDTQTEGQGERHTDKCSTQARMCWKKEVSGNGLSLTCKVSSHWRQAPPMCTLSFSREPSVRELSSKGSKTEAAAAAKPRGRARAAGSGADSGSALGNHGPLGDTRDDDDDDDPGRTRPGESRDRRRNIFERGSAVSLR